MTHISNINDNEMMPGKLWKDIKIYRIRHELLWITIFGSPMRWFDSNWSWVMTLWVVSENHWKIASLVTKKSFFTVTNVLHNSIHAILCIEHTILLKLLSITDFTIVTKYSLFWLSLVTSPQLFCDIMWMWVRDIMPSYMHVIIGTKAIFTNE